MQLQMSESSSIPVMMISPQTRTQEYNNIFRENLFLYSTYIYPIANDNSLITMVYQSRKNGHMLLLVLWFLKSGLTCNFKYKKIQCRDQIFPSPKSACTFQKTNTLILF